MAQKSMIDAKQFRIKELWPAERNVLCVLIEGPSKKFQGFEDDHVYYTGLISAYQFDTEEKMLEYVLANIYKPEEKAEKIARIQRILDRQKHRVRMTARNLEALSF